VKARAVAADVRKRLAAAGVEDAGFEAEYLVRNAAGLTRAEFFADPELAATAPLAIEEAAIRREAREPAPYITGTLDFRGLDISVGPGVLVPRPETEMLVDIACVEARGLASRPTIVDVGTGSGCIAVATAAELRERATVVAIDISGEALRYARLNAERHGAPVRFLRGDLAAAIGRADVILANLPYIPAPEIDLLEPEVSKWEPRVALDGGADGYALIRRLVADCGARLRPRLLALEVGYGMAATTAAIAREARARTNIVKDFGDIDRVVCCRWA
jgi:release factor glutamine methyltransferase